MHASVPNTPFGGVGGSGTGAYHGKYGFDTFTHNRTVLRVPSWFEYFLGFRYPPYSTKNIPKVAVNTKPGFKRGETMKDQKFGSAASGFLATVLGRGVRLGLLALALALVDARMGGSPKLLEILSGVGRTLKAKLQ